MKLSLVILSAYAGGLATLGAHAKTYRAGPQPCPAPADAVTLHRGADIVAIDLNNGREAADDIILIYDAPLHGWASRRLFARFRLDPESGRRIGPKIIKICKEPQSPAG